MSNAVLTKYREITPLNDIDTVNALLEILVNIPNSEQGRMWIRDANVGHVCVFRHHSHKGKVIEYVLGSEEDSVTTLYEDSPIFDDIGLLGSVRNDLINEIGRVTLSLPSTVGVFDVGRERMLSLKEMGTAQLMDALAKFTHTDLVTA